MIEAEIVSEKKFSLLLQEAKEITNILAASIRTTKKKNFSVHDTASHMTFDFSCQAGQCDQDFVLDGRWQMADGRWNNLLPPSSLRIQAPSFKTERSLVEVQASHHSRNRLTSRPQTSAFA